MFINLQPGDIIALKRELIALRFPHMKYYKEWDALLTAGFAQGTKFKIVDMGKIPGNMWVKIEVPGACPPKLIKISSEEYGMNFNNI